MNTNEKLIESAVNWWAEKLKKPAREGINGDNRSDASLLALFTRSTIINDDCMPDEKITLFKKLLTELLVSKQKFDWVTIETDYGPEYPLSEICHNSGISGVQFPQKTTMSINFSEQTVTWYQTRGSEGIVFPK
jgi:hypothetical protein